MEEKGKLIFKFWFKNGLFIEKEIVFDESVPQEEREKFVEGLPRLQKIIKESFKEDLKAELSINNMIVRCSELIAFDIVPIVEESED